MGKYRNVLLFVGIWGIGKKYISSGKVWVSLIRREDSDLLRELY